MNGQHRKVTRWTILRDRSLLWLFPPDPPADDPHRDDPEVLEQRYHTPSHAFTVKGQPTWPAGDEL